MSGSRVVRRRPVATLASGHEFGIFVHELTGSADGPRVGIAGGTHGDEPVTVETVRRLLIELESRELRGSVVAIPCTNPHALQALSRHTPVDELDLNRQFPGDPDGTFSQRLAHVVWSEIENCDYLIDFHGSGNDATVDYLYCHGADGIARAFGCEIVYDGVHHEGSLSGVAASHGIKPIVSELGGGQQRNDHYLQKGIRGGLNVLKHLGMLAGEPELPQRQVVVTEKVTLAPRHGGLMISDYDAASLGSSVPRDRVLGRIYHPGTLEEIDSLSAPFDDSILILVRDRFSTVDTGDYSFMIANGATARVLGQ